MAGRPLIGIVGPLGPAQLACLRSWRRAGLSTAFFHMGKRRLPGALAGLADVYRLLPDGGLNDANLASISQECTVYGIGGLTALAEQVALKLWSQKQAGGFPETRLLLNEPSLYGQLESKLAQVTLAEQAGLPVLPTTTLSCSEDSRKLPSACKMVLRPDVARFVRPMFKAELIESQTQAEAFLASHDLGGTRVVAQPFAVGPNLVIHSARAVDGSWDYHEAYLTEIKFNGLAVSLKPCPLAPELREACRCFEKSTGLSGIFHYDFLVDGASGDAFFLEVNPRLGGTTAKVFAAGYDEPRQLIAAHLPELLTPVTRADHMRYPAISRIAALKCVIAASRHPLSAIDFPANSRFRMIGSALAGMLGYRDEVFSPFDLRSNLAYLTQVGA